MESKEIFINSFLEILKENPYDVITVSEVVANTLLVRKTFYNNFSSKEDMVRYICERLMTEYMTMLTRESEFSLYGFSRTFFEFGRSNKEIFSLLLDNKLFHIFSEIFHKHMARINSIMPQSLLNALSEENVTYVFTFHAAGTLAMFELWVKAGFDKSIDEMAQIYTSIVQEVRGS